MRPFLIPRDVSDRHRDLDHRRCDPASRILTREAHSAATVQLAITPPCHFGLRHSRINETISRQRRAGHRRVGALDVRHCACQIERRQWAC
jgi:hypothetical protein